MVQNKLSITSHLQWKKNPTTTNADTVKCSIQEIGNLCILQKYRFRSLESISQVYFDELERYAREMNVATSYFDKAPAKWLSNYTRPEFGEPKESTLRAILKLSHCKLCDGDFKCDQQCWWIIHFDFFNVYNMWWICKYGKSKVLTEHVF